MNVKTIAIVAAILVIIGAGIAMARPNSENNFWNSMMGGLNNGINGMMGSGMMGTGNGNSGMMGSGMMRTGDGNGGMMGSGMMGAGNGNGGMMGSGMMGAGNGNSGMMSSGMMGTGSSFEGCGGSGTAGVFNDATPITIDQAEASINTYLENTGKTGLEIAEIIEFDNHFYAGIKEKSTDNYAIELLVNRYTGSVFPEMGPNMMWNTKYSHMNWNTQGTDTVTEEQAIEIAQKYLDTAAQPGTEVEGADAFYGYYTLEVIKDGNVYGMLSVNANTGAVWYHNWHGTFIRILEVE
ncbi:MAG: PepSY domain-containing protein [Candidatus Methanoperedens sp.]|nr:PepSY domain-containing protein [Candidatus Methanoperedens sp.]